MAHDKQTIDDLVNGGLLDQWYAVAKSVQVKPGMRAGARCSKHDVGVSRLRQALVNKAKAQLAAQEAARTRPAV